ncbi:ABC transporter ATP-binding protein [Pedobacter glucosidilyticus]|uniref:ABC transporter ATP-binding protein n=1 Tax=Pedobacter glucosidilyticus TaxID=1122941 RepID=UPI0004046949|nr:ABC transporter ATP-binding protein [Pedobacter glucosidilyticus]
MEIILNQVSRRFNREWIFKEINYTFSSGNAYALLGINGSGKSTLLQIISGSLAPSAGIISYKDGEGNPIEVENIFEHISIAAPYLELIEDFTLQEIIKFHFSFKKRFLHQSDDDVIAILNMAANKNKAVKYFSSGMKQRVKLALAFLSDTPILILDEPTANLDEQGSNWYLEMIKKYSQNRLILIGSNQPQEYSFSENHLYLANYKS